jgi:hypothetical protein
VAEGEEGSCAHGAIMREKRDRWQISNRGFHHPACGSPIRTRTPIG